MKNWNIPLVESRLREWPLCFWYLLARLRFSFGGGAKRVNPVIRIQILWDGAATHPMMSVTCKIEN